MNQTELQYILRIMSDAEIKGNQAVFHAQLMSKIANILKEQNNAPVSKPEEVDGD